MTSILLKTFKPFDSVWGWICTILTFCISFLGDGVNMLFAMLALVLIDAFFGTWVSIKKGRYFESRRLRETVAKLFVYFGLQIASFILDKVLTTDLICIRATTALVIVCEIWSIIANVTIIYPKFIIGKLLKKYLSAEIGNKLGIDQEEVQKMMEETKEKEDTNKQ